MNLLESLVVSAAKSGASVLLLSYGGKPKVRILGDLVTMSDAPVLDDSMCTEIAKFILDGDELFECGDKDVARTYEGYRVRINLYRVQQHYSIAIRLLNRPIPPLETLGLPPAVLRFPRLKKGIILVCGDTGSGKSTTLASLVDSINHTRRCHVITLEDPVEYVHVSDKSLVEQREIGRDAMSYATGLHASLREDPDVLLIGEIRDFNTVDTTLTAAETGHLVLATVHTNSAADCVDRLVAVYPPERQASARVELSLTLQAVLFQQLLPRADRKGMALACELMIVNTAIRAHIREGKTTQIPSDIDGNQKDGCISMDLSLVNLAKQGVITPELAVASAHDPDAFRRQWGGQLNLNGSVPSVRR